VCATLTVVLADEMKEISPVIFIERNLVVVHSDRCTPVVISVVKEVWWRES